MVLAFDPTVLLDNVEGVLAVILTALSVAVAVFQLLGKKKWADKAKATAEALEKSEKDVTEALDAVKTLIIGVGIVKDTFRPIIGESSPIKETSRPSKNAGEIIAEYASRTGTLDLLNKFVVEFSRKE